MTVFEPKIQPVFLKAVIAECIKESCESYTFQSADRNRYPEARSKDIDTLLPFSKVTSTLEKWVKKLVKQKFQEFCTNLKLLSGYLFSKIEVHYTIGPSKEYSTQHELKVNPLVQRLFAALPSAVVTATSMDNVFESTTPIIVLARNINSEKLLRIYEKAARECSDQIFSFFKLEIQEEEAAIICYDTNLEIQDFPLDDSFEEMFCSFLQALEVDYAQNTIEAPCVTCLQYGENIPWQAIKKENQLGAGGQGIVWKATYNGNFVAIKKHFSQTEEAKHMY
jgi:hypothetical protein